MLIILKKIRELCGDMRLSMVLDNATWHRSRIVTDFAESPEVDIRLIFNVTGRPDWQQWALKIFGQYVKIFTGDPSIKLKLQMFNIAMKCWSEIFLKASVMKLHAALLQEHCLL